MSATRLMAERDLHDDPSPENPVMAVLRGEGLHIGLRSGPDRHYDIELRIADAATDPTPRDTEIPAATMVLGGLDGAGVQVRLFTTWSEAELRWLAKACTMMATELRRVERTRRRQAERQGGCEHE